MELLSRYVQAAMALGLIDEWHVWDFSRNREDAQWLREKFPVAQATPNYGLEYFQAPERLVLREGVASLQFEVRATNDVHLGLRRLSGAGSSFEIVLGGWGNNVSVIREFDDGEKLLNVEARDRLLQPVVVRESRGLLPEYGFSKVNIEVQNHGLKVFVAEEPIFQYDSPISPGLFEIVYKTGYGSNGDWRFSSFKEHASRLFVYNKENYLEPNAMFYTAAYQYYAAIAQLYANDIILKCDDDIVYLDLSRLGEYIFFRRQRPEFFLVSANVINNGVCAFYQQSLGSIPTELGEFELPSGGFCGSLWNSGAKAERLHDFFLHNPRAFGASDIEVIPWNHRLSINFVALLGKDLSHIPDVMHDDEHDLCYGVRKRAKKQNCIYAGFVVSHLSFWKQEQEMQVSRLLKDYEDLSLSALSASRFSENGRD